jgi:hypothetical protein
MATDKQITLLKTLYEELGQEPEDIENMTNKEASRAIDDLIAIKNERNKFEPHDDDCYYYK